MTDVGREIYRQCETIAEGIDATQAIAARARSQISGNLRIACPPGLARYLRTDVFARFLLLYPDVHLEMHISSQRIDLIQERFDAAFRVDIDTVHDQALTMHQLGRLDRILVAAPAVAAQVAATTIASLADLPTLSVGEHVEHDEWLLMNGQGRQHVVAHHPRFCSNDSATVRDAAVAGLGVALLSSAACSVELQQGQRGHRPCPLHRAHRHVADPARVHRLCRGKLSVADGRPAGLNGLQRKPASLVRLYSPPTISPSASMCAENSKTISTIIDPHRLEAILL